jgi:hypothetical protein
MKYKAVVPRWQRESNAIIGAHVASVYFKQQLEAGRLEAEIEALTKDSFAPCAHVWVGKRLGAVMQRRRVRVDVVSDVTGAALVSSRWASTRRANETRCEVMVNVEIVNVWPELVFVSDLPFASTFF